MKSIAFILSAALLTFACSNGSGEQQEEVVVEYDNYGPVNVDPEKAISVEEMLKDFSSKSGEVEYTFAGEITEVCSKAGCWVNINKGDGETFMVRFKDHFTIPIETEVGIQAYLHGVAFMDTIPVDILRHYAEDAGKSKEEIESITEPKFEMNFVADGIAIAK